MPINYSGGIIYKICCRDTSIADIYIGSTTSFRSRKSTHAHTYNLPNSPAYNYPIYVTIRANGNWDNWDMVEIERYNAVDKRDLLKRERYWIELMKPSMNGNIPGRTMVEYRQDNKVERNLYNKQHYQDHKQDLSIKKKQYYIDNKQAVLAQKKQYHQDKKDVRICGCGGSYNHGDTHKRNRHYKSMRHIKFAADLPTIE
jgi:hypothetical protein